MVETILAQCVTNMITAVYCDNSFFIESLWNIYLFILIDNNLLKIDIE